MPRVRERKKKGEGKRTRTSAVMVENERKEPTKKSRTGKREGVETAASTVMAETKSKESDKERKRKTTKEFEEERAEENRQEAFKKGIAELHRKGWTKLANKVILNARKDGDTSIVSHLAVVYTHGNIAANEEGEQYAAKISGERTQWRAGLGDYETNAANLVNEVKGAKDAYDSVFGRVEDFASQASGKTMKVDKKEVSTLMNGRATERSQPVHSDSMYKDNLRSVVALTDIEEPTRFLDYSVLGGDGEDIIGLDKSVGDDGKFSQVETIAAFGNRFGGMLPSGHAETQPVCPGWKQRSIKNPKTRAQAAAAKKGKSVMEIGARLHRKIKEATTIQELAQVEVAMKKGEVLVFWGDTCHYGPRLLVSSRRQILFIPLTYHGNYDSDKQLHPIAVAEYLYGRDSNEQLEVMFCFWKAVEPGIEASNSEIMSLSGKAFDDFSVTAQDKILSMEAIHTHYLKMVGY